MPIHRSTNCAAALLVAVLVEVSHGQAVSQVWQGAFRTPSAWGAMELRLTGEVVQLTLAPDARPASAPVTQFSLTNTRISFHTTVDSRSYRFEGRRRGDRLEGTLTASNDGERGTWGLSQLSAETKYTESLPAPTGLHATGRVALAWVDQARRELETRVSEDKRELLVYVF